ncbi:hypothetical protein, partial [Nocardia sp. CNY236]|uniref:hypothetical protein n=1 Tax=Nocardia sp. CNY236 TaxID=1169152 RepID=UPI00056B9613
MTGPDPVYINSMEHFESMRHEEIYTKAQQIDAASILHASTTWLEVAGALTTSFPLTRDAVDRVMNSMDWQGATAEAAMASARSFAASVDELASVLGQVGARLGGVAAAAEAVKLAVVPPGDSGPVGTIARALEAAGVIDAHMAQEALRHEAILVMNMVYKPAYSAAGSGVPALPAPPEVPMTPSDPPAGGPTRSGHSIPEGAQPDSPPKPDTTPPTPSPPTPSVPQNDDAESAERRDHNAEQTPPAPTEHAPSPTPPPASTPPPVPRIPEPTPSTPPPIPSPTEPQ